MRHFSFALPALSRRASRDPAIHVIVTVGLALGSFVAAVNSDAAGPPPDKDNSSSAEVPFRPFRGARRFPVVDDFKLVAADDIENLINPHELVIGVTIDDAARAYPINMLNGPTREIINDTLANKPIAATW